MDFGKDLKGKRHVKCLKQFWAHNNRDELFATVIIIIFTKSQEGPRKL